MPLVDQQRLDLLGFVQLEFLRLFCGLGMGVYVSLSRVSWSGNIEFIKEVT